MTLSFGGGREFPLASIFKKYFIGNTELQDSRWQEAEMRA